MSSDPISDVIALSGAKCTVTRCMETDGEWNYRFLPPGVIKFIAIRRGHCWLSQDGAAPMALREDDVFMLQGNTAFALASNLDRSAVDATGKFRAVAPLDQPKPLCFQAICGHVSLDARRGRMLADALPEIVLVRGDTREADAMRWLLNQLIFEINGRRLGAALASTELAQLLFLHLIRACASSDIRIPIGWVAALTDERIAKALSLLHSSPSSRWRVDQLAAKVGMSRTSFAVRFSELVGAPPIAYLWTWRMRLAEQALRTSDLPIAEIARLTGFANVSGFSSAFRRTYSHPPKDYRLLFTQVPAQHRNDARDSFSQLAR